MTGLCFFGWGEIQIFWVMIACNMIAAFLALFWLKPVARRTIAKADAMAKAEAAASPISGGKASMGIA